MSGDNLDALANRADSLASPSGPDDAAPGGDTPPPGPTESPNYGAIGFMLSAFRELACRGLGAESPRVTLSDDNIEKITGALTPVADKYGLNLGGVLAGPEGVALMVAGPLLWDAGAQLNAEMKAKRAKKVAEPQGEADPAPQAS